jgi:exonuclease III
VSWNVRGLGQSAKCDLVQDALALARPHIAFLQESKLLELTPLQRFSFLTPHLDAYLEVPALGSKGGIITAWNSSVFQLQSYILHAHSVTVCLKYTASGYSFHLTNIYTLPDHRDIDAFLHELSDIATYPDRSWLLVGDFNLTRSPSDKNTVSFQASLAAAFNNTIEKLALVELPLLDRLFTWSNNRSSPTLARLGRAMINNNFSAMFPNTTLTSLTRTTSDHVPLLVSIDTSVLKPQNFRFERSWLLHISFLPAVLSTWNSAPVHGDKAAALTARVKELHHDAKVWVRKQRNPSSIFHNCSFIIKLLDMFEECCDMSVGELYLHQLCKDHLSLLVLEKVVHWKQRGKFKAIREGNENTRFFHAKASMRLRKNQIRMVEADGVAQYSQRESRHPDCILQEPPRDI